AVSSRLKGGGPSQPCGREILTITLSDAHASSVEEEFRLLTVGVNLYGLLFAGLAPAYRPAMSVNANHRLFGPVGLKYVECLFWSQISFHDALLVHIRNWIFGTYRCGEVLEWPVGSAGKPGHRL